jgi:hypothetical protein
VLHDPIVVDRNALAVLHQTDAFQAAGGKYRGFARDDALRRKRDGLQPRTAEAVHRHARYGDRQAGADRRLPRDIAAGRALRQRTAENDVFHLRRIDAGARDRLFDYMAAELGAMRHVEGAAIGLADRRAGGGNDHGVGHRRSPFWLL